MTIATEQESRSRTSRVPTAGAVSSRVGVAPLLPLIVVMPFMTAPAISGHIIDIPGFRLPNIIAGVAFLVFLAKGASIPRDKLGRAAFFGFLAYAAFFAIDFVRSIPHLHVLHGRFPDAIALDVREYAQSEFIGPLLFAASFVYVLTKLNDADKMTLTIQAIGTSLFILSCVVLTMVAYDPDAFFTANRAPMLDLTRSVLGMHYNAVGTIYAVFAPLLLFMAIKRGGFWTLGFVLALVAVLLLKSRTSMLTFAGISALTLIALGRARILVVAAPVVLVGVLALTGPVLIDLLSQGFTQKSGISLWGILSGREQAMWLPLLFEWFNDPGRLYFGEGLYGILTSNLLFNGVNFAAGQAHNFYLEFFLDNGIFLTLAFFAGLVAWLVWAYRTGRRIRSELYWVLYLCVVSFLITGITGRRFFPDSENILMFPLLGLLFNVARLKVCEQALAARSLRAAISDDGPARTSIAR